MSSNGRVELSDAEVERFTRQGFLCVSEVVSPEEIEALKPLYDEIVQDRMGCTPAAMGCMIRLHERPLLVVYPPEGYIRRLQETLMFRNAIAAVARLYGVPASGVVGGWRLFFKPARYAATEWHQDAAYRPPPHETISVWIPLDPATRESSCLSYIPGSHEGRVVRRHRLEGDHMVTEDVDAAEAVECPIPPTSAIIHHSCTVHCSGANVTEAPRRAFGIVCRAA